jgi:hypothetical protein
MTSLCKGKRTSQPNRCIKVKGCKVAKGTKRSFCRKKHNKTKKSSRKTRGKGRTEVSRLKGHSKKTERALKKLK